MATIPFIRMFARPVIVMVPAMMPAIPQAAATEMHPFPPTARAAHIPLKFMRYFLLGKLTIMAATMERAAAVCIVLVEVLTSHMSITIGMSR